MKNFLSLICASVLGAVLTLGIVEYSADSDHSMLSLNQSPTNVHTVSNRAAIASPAAAYDFVEASDIATKAVVHIYAEESKVLAQQRIQKQRSQRNNQRSNDPFGFFGFDDFFGGGGDIYGRGNNQQQSGMGSGVIL